jgi:hypothetical protein
MNWKLTDGTKESLPKKSCNMLVRLDVKDEKIQEDLLKIAREKYFGCYEAYQPCNDDIFIFENDAVTGDALVSFNKDKSEIIMSIDSYDGTNASIISFSLLRPGIPYLVIPEMSEEIHQHIKSYF